MRGGRSRYSYFSGFPLSWSIQLGPHFRELTIGSIKMVPIIFRRFIHRNFSAARRTQFSGRSLSGGHRGCCSRPRFLVLWAPAGFRLTCYYYRGAYYKAFWADPPACAVGEPRKGYPGENSFPLIMQNIHRYFLYLALLFILVLAHDAWKAMWFSDRSGSKHFGIGVGTIVLTLNVILAGQLHVWLSFAPPFDRRVSWMRFPRCLFAPRATPA